MNILDLSTYENVYVTGDIHGEFATLTYTVSQVKKYTNSLIIVCGDIGLGFNSEVKDLNNLNQVESKLTKTNNHLVLFRGNHDNPWMFSDKNKWKNDLQEECPHISVIDDYTIIKTCVGNILCVGGARSVDKCNRIKDYSWWEDECVKKIPRNFFTKLQTSNVFVDIICTHCAPTFAEPIFDTKYTGSLVEACSLTDKTLIQDIKRDRNLLKQLYEKLNDLYHVKYWFYGHYHNHYETEFNNTKLIGLDMCYTKKRYVGKTSDGKMIYKNLCDFYKI